MLCCSRFILLVLALLTVDCAWADTDGLLILDFKQASNDAYQAAGIAADGTTYAVVRGPDNLLCAMVAVGPSGDLVSSFGTAGRLEKQPCGTKIVVVPSQAVLVQSPGTNSQLTLYDATGKVLGTNPSQLGIVANAMAVQPDGRIVLVGYPAAAKTDFALTRLNPDLTPDGTFGGGMPVIVDGGGGGSSFREELRGVALAPDGKIVVAGDSERSGGGGIRVIARFNANGTQDFGFGNNGQIEAGNGHTLAIDSAGRSYFQDLKKVGRLDASGHRDLAYTTPILMDARTLTFDSQGRLIASGTDDTTGPRQAYVARLTAAGALDTSFATAGELSFATGYGLCGNDGLLAPGDRPLMVLCVASSEWDPNAARQIDLGLFQLKEDGTPDATFAANTPDADLYPDAFTISGASVPYGTAGVVSSLLTLTGFNAATPIYVTGGEFAINCQGTFAISGVVAPGQSFCVRKNAPTTASASVQASVTVGSRSATFTVTSTTEAADTTPDAFSFINQTDVAVNTSTTSNAISIAGIAGLAEIAVEQGQYSVGCTAQGFTTNRGTVFNGQTICVRHTSSAQNSTSVSTTLAVGGVTATFMSTTVAAPSGGGSGGGGSGGGTTPPPASGSGGGGAMDWLSITALFGLLAWSIAARRPSTSGRT